MTAIQLKSLQCSKCRMYALLNDEMLCGLCSSPYRAEAASRRERKAAEAMNILAALAVFGVISVVVLIFGLVLDRLGK